MDGEELENASAAGGLDGSGKRRLVSIPHDMTTELEILNDQEISEEDMVYHIRQFVATFAKRIKESTQNTKETRIKLETSFKKVE